MKFFICILLVMLVGAIAGPIGGGLIMIALFIAEEVNNSKLSRQREEHKAYEAKLLNELSEIKEKEKIQEEIKVAVKNLKNAIHEHEVKKSKKITNKEMIYVVRGKRHIYDGENFIEIGDD